MKTHNPTSCKVNVTLTGAALSLVLSQKQSYKEKEMMVSKSKIINRILSGGDVNTNRIKHDSISCTVTVELTGSALENVISEQAKNNKKKNIPFQSKEDTILKLLTFAAKITGMT